MIDENKSKEQLVKEIRQLRQRIGELEASKKERMSERELNFELDQIFNTAADGMRVIDKNFTVVRVNETLLKLSGRSMEEVSGRQSRRCTLDCRGFSRRPG